MARLIIDNRKKFDNQVWQYTTEFTQEQYQSWLHGAIQSLQTIYENIDNDEDQYLLGDVINLLSNTTIEFAAPPRRQTYVLVHEWRDGNYNEDNEVLCTSSSPEKIYEALARHKASISKSFHQEYDDCEDANTIKTCDTPNTFSIYINEYEIYDSLIVHLADEV